MPSNVASLELCRELYELSGWDDTFFFHDFYHKKNGELGNHQISTKAQYQWNNRCPAYDLGYLWRKFEELGNEQSVGYDDSGCYYHFTYGQRGSGRQIGDIGTTFSGEPQDSIEDGFCEFFIELFKQGVLTNA